MKILGVSHPYRWNVAAALLIDGELIAFCEEERFTRVKHAPRSFPQRAIRGIERRHPEAAFTSEHHNLAAAVQAALERGLLQMARFLVEKPGSRALCMAGGVADAAE